MFIFEDTKIYIMAPANTASGGPLLLHQLCYNLRKRNIDAYMVYVMLISAIMSQYMHFIKNSIYLMYKLKILLIKMKIFLLLVKQLRILYTMKKLVA